jgi:hypothetical protein
LRPASPNLSRNVPSDVFVLLKPSLALDLLEVGPSLGVFVKDFGDDFLKAFGEVAGEETFAINYFFVGDIFVLGFEGSLAGCKLIEKNAESPNVYSLIVLAALDDFGWDVVDCAAEGLALAA